MYICYFSDVLFLVLWNFVYCSAVLVGIADV